MLHCALARRSSPSSRDMASLDSPESLAAAWQARLDPQRADDAWVAWGVKLAAQSFRDFPGLGSLAACSGPEYHDGVERPSHRRVLAGHATPKTTHFFTFDQLSPLGRSRHWPRDALADMWRAERLFSRLSGDPRLQPFIRTARATDPGFKIWIQRGGDPVIERHICKAIGRPELWAAMEAGQLRNSTPNSGLQRAPSRI